MPEHIHKSHSKPFRFHTPTSTSTLALHATPSFVPQLCPETSCTSRHGNRVKLHTAQQLEGQVPDQRLTNRSLHIFPVCFRLISFRSRPRCNPTSSNPVSQFTERPPCTPTHLKWTRSFFSRVPLRTHIPKAAQDAWPAVFWLAFSALTSNNDTRVWTELFVPLEAAAPPGTWRETEHQTLLKRQATAVLEGAEELPGRKTTYASPGASENTTTSHQNKMTQRAISRKETSEPLPWRRRANLSTACTALLDEPPASNTELVAKEERDRHTQPLAEDVARMKLLRVAPVSLAATPSLSSAEDAQSAIHEELLRDEIMRGLHSVGGIVARGHIPGPVVSCVVSASLTALKKQDVNHRPVAVEDTRGFAGHGDQGHDTLPPFVAAGGLERRTVARPSSTAFDGGYDAMTTTNSAAFHGSRERAQPLARSSTNRFRTDQVQRLVQFERQLSLVFSREHPEQKMSSTGPFGLLLFALGLHGAISEGRIPCRGHQLPSVHGGLPFTTGPFAHPTKPHRRSSKASRQAWTTRCLQLNIPKCEYILAEPLPSSVHPVKALAEWRVRHDKCFALLGAAFGPPGLCLHMLLGKLDQAEKLMAQFVRPSPVPTTTVVLLRFCFGWCQISCHARKMPPDSLHFCAIRYRHPSCCAWSASPIFPTRTLVTWISQLTEHPSDINPRTGPAHLFDTSSRLSACHFATGSLGFHDRRSSLLQKRMTDGWRGVA